MSDRKEIRAEWMRLNREVSNPLPNRIACDEAFGTLTDWLDDDGPLLWNVIPIVARAKDDE